MKQYTLHIIDPDSDFDLSRVNFENVTNHSKQQISGYNERSILIELINQLNEDMVSDNDWMYLVDNLTGKVLID